MNRFKFRQTILSSSLRIFILSVLLVSQSANADGLPSPDEVTIEIIGGNSPSNKTPPNNHELPTLPDLSKSSSQPGINTDSPTKPLSPNDTDTQ